MQSTTNATITKAIARSISHNETVTVTARDVSEYKALRADLVHRDTGREDFVDVDDTDPSRVRVEAWGADWRVHVRWPAAPTAERLERLAAIIRASDDEGTIQAEDMAAMFPEPTLHTTTGVRSALAAAGATKANLLALARATDDDAIEACALHQASTWDEAAE